STVELEDYTLLNIAASYEIYEQVELFARVENLLDEQYQEVFSFAARGIAGYGGIRVTFGPFL
ncbi:MAG TPA: TonB-dependent receptor, partial [Methylococcaceae bacterium]|nr:TonB-dependent receptor [Methylococcaceae bacterium]